MAQGMISGSARVQDFEHPEYLKKLEEVSGRLMEAIPQAGFTPKALGHLMYGLSQFMEDALGLNALPPKPFPKLPAQLLRNYASEGPIYVIAQVCYAHMKAKQLRKMDFLLPARRKENMEVLSSIRQELARAGYQRMHRVHIHPSCGNEVARLTQIVRKLGGEVAQSDDVAGLTHIVVPYGPAGDPDDGQQYMKTLHFRGHEAFVHWWYYPDSYDEWVPRDTAPVDPEPAHRMPGPVKVFLRWLYDSEKYNEWMNAQDYETEEHQEAVEAWEKARVAAEAQDMRRSSGVVNEDEDRDEDEESATLKRRRAEDAPSSPKKARTEGDPSTGGVTGGASGAREGEEEVGPRRGPLPEVEAGAGVQLAEGVVKQVVVEPPKAAFDPSAPAEDISNSQQRGGNGNGAVPAPAVPVEEPRDELPPAPMRELYRVPAHAAWFEWDKVHEIEMRNVPEFFSGKFAPKTPKVYREYRNFMINKYREDTSRYLSFTDCRKLLTGDANSILRVWGFLDHWGLINFLATSRPPAAPPATLVAAPDGAATQPLAATAALAPPLNADSLFRLGPVQSDEVAAAITSGGGPTARLVNRQNMVGQRGGAKEQVKFYCNAHPWHECGSVRYHCTKIPDIDLCAEAYTSGALPPGCTKADFVAIDAGTASAEGSDGWSDQETLLLLEGLEMYGDNWAEVAEHVGSRSQLQCVTRFLTLPIEEQFLDALDVVAPGVAGPLPAGEAPDEGVAAAVAAEQAEPIPFADCGNPVMAQMAFLAQMVGPRVAAAAAQAALQVLADGNPAAAEEVAAAAAEHGVLLDTEAKEPEGAGAAGRLAGTGAREAAVSQGAAASVADGAAAAGEAGINTQEPTTAAPPAASPSAEKLDARGEQGGNPAASTAAAAAPGMAATAGAAAAAGPGAAAVAGADGAPSALQLKVAAATALSAAAVKAKLMADAQEREIQKAMMEAVEVQVQKVRLKMRYVDALEEALENERKAMEVQRGQMLREMMALAEARIMAPSMPTPIPSAAAMQSAAGETAGAMYVQPGISAQGGMLRAPLQLNIGQQLQAAQMQRNTGMLPSHNLQSNGPGGGTGGAMR